MSNYPDGMSRADLIHVGEIEDDFKGYDYDTWLTDEEADEIIETGMSEYGDDVTYNLIEKLLDLNQANDRNASVKNHAITDLYETLRKAYIEEDPENRLQKAYDSYVEDWTPDEPDHEDI